MPGPVHGLPDGLGLGHSPGDEALGLGPLIDRFGAKAMMGLTIFLTGIHAFTLAGTQEMWNNDTYVLVMMSTWILLLPVIMVCALALAMMGGMGMGRGKGMGRGRGPG